METWSIFKKLGISNLGDVDLVMDCFCAIVGVFAGWEGGNDRIPSVTVKHLFQLFGTTHPLEPKECFEMNPLQWMTEWKLFALCNL